ncbi:MarR family winged helix-turn-helix transcriptional regulator [Zeimonas arvi]|uniref:MarR family transcriptional regulator n=1 Tax=Zeimonas arvi TaxID=2498847 RepID=A0A5C8P192_9BURK|nr:MarR family transcriptional regulator [Zeimonas arvi]TXL67118.1 MarR family transcriptional regulator [Zeimonas arvi]
MGARVPIEQTLQVRDACLCLHAQRAARALARRFDEALRPFGLTNGQFSLLMALNRPAPPAPGEVARTLAMDRTTLTAALKPLARDGLVDIAVDPGDRRGRRLTLTAAGHARLDAALTAWRALHRAIEAELEAGGVVPDKLRKGLRALDGAGS